MLPAGRVPKLVYAGAEDILLGGVFTGRVTT